jgi:hypothetical protein
VITQQEEFLGDGLYASVEDGWLVRLRAPRENGDHVVYLEPEIFAALIAWHTRTVAKGALP